MADLTRDQIYGALEQDRLEIYGQPKWILGQNTCNTYEVFADLLIGENNERYLPRQFLPIIEADPELTIAFGKWFLRRAFEGVVSMNEEVGFSVTLSINIFGFQADRPEFVDQVVDLAAQTGLRFRNLQFELSDKQPIGPVGEQNLIRLRNELGVRLVLDNFGRNYSNIDLLRRIPFDEIDLSKEFTKGITSLEHELKVICAIQQMAQVLDLTVCAKGIETAEQLELLEEAGFQMGQGYLIGRPMQRQELKAYILKYGSVQEKPAAVPDDRPSRTDPVKFTV